MDSIVEQLEIHFLYLYLSDVLLILGELHERKNVLHGSINAILQLL